MISIANLPLETKLPDFSHEFELLERVFFSFIDALGKAKAFCLGDCIHFDGKTENI